MGSFPIFSSLQPKLGSFFQRAVSNEPLAVSGENWVRFAKALYWLENADIGFVFYFASF